ncbi:A24 family peptidase [Advenella faeciporci]|nr:prepilin peptidase [Advenella faeciporci]
MSSSIWPVLFAIFCLLVITSDFRKRRISNQLLLAALLVHAGFLLANTFVPEVLALPATLSWRQCITGFLMGLLVFFPFWGLKLLGAGDVKLIATLGFLLGFAGLWQVVLVATVLTGLHAVLTVLAQGWLSARASWWNESKEKRRGVPYGAWLAVTALAWVGTVYWSGYAWF